MPAYTTATALNYERLINVNSLGGMSTKITKREGMIALLLYLRDQRDAGIIIGNGAFINFEYRMNKYKDLPLLYTGSRKVGITLGGMRLPSVSINKEPQRPWEHYVYELYEKHFKSKVQQSKVR